MYDVDNPLKLIRMFLYQLNDRKIVNIDEVVKDITIYANKENILKLQQNKSNATNYEIAYNRLLEKYEEVINNCGIDN